MLCGTPKMFQIGTETLLLKALNDLSSEPEELHKIFCSFAQYVNFVPFNALTNVIQFIKISAKRTFVFARQDQLCEI